MTSKAQISVVLGSYNRLWALKETIRSVRENGISVPYEIIVVDGGSTDGALPWLIEQSDILTIVQHNRPETNSGSAKRSWGYFMNLAFKACEGAYTVMISDDCIVHPGSIMAGYELIKSRAGERVGACAYYWRNYPKDDRYFVGLTLGDRMFVNHGMFATEALWAVDWIDEETYHFYHADGDLALKLWRSGYTIVDCPQAKVDHFDHANTDVRSKNFQQQPLDWQNYLKKWTGVYYDPAKENFGGWLYLDEPADNRYARAWRPVKPTNRARLKKAWRMIRGNSE